ncbi:MAG: hypothetical protein RIS94_1592, partial [Pseudomonadota bacterium]
MIGCPVPDAAMGVVHGTLYSISCNVEAFSQGGYEALSGSASFLPQAVTALMVLYVGLLGFRLMFGVGDTRLGDVGVMGLKIGFVLTLAFNWTVFQTLIFDVALDGPLQIADTVSGAMADGGSVLAGDPVDGLQLVYDELGRDATGSAQSPGGAPSAGAQSASLPAPGDAAANGAVGAVGAGVPAAPGAERLLRAQTVLLYATVGTVAVAIVALGILAAIGPLFIALAVLGETLGLFIGWLRAMLAFTILSTLAWLTNLLLLTTIEPWLIALREGAEAAREGAGIVAIIVDVFAAAQIVLLGSAGIIACGLRLVPRPRNALLAEPDRSRQASLPPSLSRVERLALDLQPSAMASRRDGGSRGHAQAAGRSAGAGSSRSAQSVAAGRPLPPGALQRRQSPFERLRKG